ncbi:MAG: transglutaminase family protein [Phycisphaerae bacterium]
MNRNRIRGSRVLLAVAAVALVARPAQAKPLTPPDFDEGWYVVTMEDPATGRSQQAGYMHNVLRRAGDEMHARNEMKFQIRRGQAVIKIAVTQTSRETLEGRPLAFGNRIAFGTAPQTIRGTIDKGVLTLISEQFGVETKKTYPFDPEIRFSWGLMLQQHEHGLKPGTTFDSKIYDPSLRMDGPVDVTVTVHGKETVEVLGRRRRLTRITTSMKLDKGAGGALGAPGGGASPLGGRQIDSDTWVDDDLIPVVMTMDLGIMKVKLYKTTKTDAMKQGAPPEMFLTTFIPIDRRIGNDAKRVKLRLTLKKNAKGPLPTLPDTAMQTYRRVSDREAIVTLRRIDWHKIRKVEAVPETFPADMKVYRTASAVCDSGDRKIKRLARRAVRGKKTPADMADALRKFVTRYITDKNMDVGFATASDVARNRSGDCTEHGVLLAAVARAAGLPARGVGGIVEIPSGYPTPNGGSSFGYHMWTQVYIGDQWVDIDAALRQTDCAPNHLAVSLMPLGEEGMIDFVMKLIPLLGQLRIEVIEVER